MKDSKYMDKIAVILPTYNAEKYLRRCLDSIISQTYSNIEIIIINDGSTDNTKNIAEEYERIDERILLINQINRGVSAARNEGVHKSCSEWIMFVDSDDCLKYDYCEQMLRAARQMDADVMISGSAPGPISLINDEKQKLIRSCFAFDEQSFFFNIDAVWGKIFRSSIIFDNEITFPEELPRSEDASFCIQMYYHSGNIGYFCCDGYSHNQIEGSLSHRYNPRTGEILEKILMHNSQLQNKYNFTDEQDRQALFFRVLPGLVECEQSYYLNKNNKNSIYKKIREYARLLHSNAISKAIKEIEFSKITNRNYKMRLILYKMHMGWVIILLKRNELY